MAAGSVEQRLTAVEIRVERIDALTVRVEGCEQQILQLRTEMRVGFSALHEAVGDLREETRALIGEVREETRALIRESREETRALIRDGDEETRRYMRVLHEEALGRIATIGEGLSVGPRRGRKKR